jgi:hypothetical protein
MAKMLIRERVRRVRANVIALYAEWYLAHMKASNPNTEETLEDLIKAFDEDSSPHIKRLDLKLFEGIELYRVPVNDSQATADVYAWVDYHTGRVTTMSQLFDGEVTPLCYSVFDASEPHMSRVIWINPPKAKEPPKPVNIVQDGDTFYLDGEGVYRSVIRVTDHDTDAAHAARNEFLEYAELRDWRVTFV